MVVALGETVGQHLDPPPDVPGSTPGEFHFVCLGILKSVIVFLSFV